MCLLIKFSKVNTYQECDHELWIGSILKKFLIWWKNSSKKKSYIKQLNIILLQIKFSPNVFLNLNGISTNNIIYVEIAKVLWYNFQQF
jgi:hypothetical protein